MASDRPDHTLQATVLVHEAYVRLFGDADVKWSSRQHFFATAAEAMRQILIDHARKRGRVKRGRAPRRRPLNAVDLAVDPDSEEILNLDEAICRLREQDAQSAEIVRLRFYAGLSIQDTAQALGLSESTVKRAWNFARVWLYGALKDDTG